MKSNQIKTFRNWYREPSSWLSLAAAAISIATFFLVYANPGDLLIYLPDKVGLTVKHKSLELALPLTFTNTGATRTHRQILNLSATFTPVGDTIPSTSLRWDYEGKFTSGLEFRKRYPQFRDSALMDYVEYVNRAFPFHLPGGTSTTRVYILTQSKGIFRQSRFGAFRVVVKITTDKEVTTIIGTYDSPGNPLDNTYSWCLRKQ